MSAPQQQQQDQPQTQGSVFDDLIKIAFVVAAMLAVALVALPLVAPLLSRAFTPPSAARKPSFWRRRRGMKRAALVGVVIVLAVTAMEVAWLVQWFASGAASTFFAGNWWPALIERFWPWLVLNVLLGVLLVPAQRIYDRWTTARAVVRRRIPDVVRQEQIEDAIAIATDDAAAARIGVRVDHATGNPSVSTSPVYAPRQVGKHWAFGEVLRADVAGYRDPALDRERRVPGWTDDSGRSIIVPGTAGAVRAVVVAESGVGKTYLFDAIAASTWKTMRPRIVLIDGKGNPKDAAATAAKMRALGATTQIAPRWNMFNGDAAQITSKLMRLLPPPDGANQHYLSEARMCLHAVQAHTPLSSVDDLRDRLQHPRPHVRSEDDARVVMDVTNPKTGQSRGDAVLVDLLAALMPLEPWLDADGWTFDSPAADVTILPLVPVDETQALLADMILFDLRAFLARRFATGDESDYLVLVDEFPQLVAPGIDPADTATRLFETMRSANVGLILAGQSVAGFANTDVTRERLLNSGAALILGRQKSPDPVVALAGTFMRQEAGGDAEGAALKSARAQHTYRIPPNRVRAAAGGQFWIVQGGSLAAFRVLPTNAAASQPAADHSPAIPDGQPSPVAIEPVVIDPAALLASPRAEERAAAAVTEPEPAPTADDDATEVPPVPVAEVAPPAPRKAPPRAPGT